MYKFSKFVIPNTLADAIDNELHTVKVRWQYCRITTKYKHWERNGIGEENKIGDYVVNDTQKFSQEFYNFEKPQYRSFSFEEQFEKQTNPLQQLFPNSIHLIKFIHEKMIPRDYVVFRAMANMQVIRPHWCLNAPHPDHRDPSFKTCLYYVNDSDGDTLFFDDKDKCIARTPPVKGTGIVYPSSVVHAGSTPIEHETRVVINMIFAPREKVQYVDSTP